MEVAKMVQRTLYTFTQIKMQKFCLTSFLITCLLHHILLNYMEVSRGHCTHLPLNSSIHVYFLRIRFLFFLIFIKIRKLKVGQYYYLKQIVLKKL